MSDIRCQMSIVLRRRLLHQNANFVPPAGTFQRIKRPKYWCCRRGRFVFFVDSQKCKFWAIFHLVAPANYWRSASSCCLLAPPCLPVAPFLAVLGAKNFIILKSLANLWISIDFDMCFYFQPTGFTNLDHLAVYKKSLTAILAAASAICLASNIFFYSINRGEGQQSCEVIKNEN